MNSAYSRILVLLFLAISISASAQSLADVARQTREEKQQHGGTHARVITNDDIASHDSAASAPDEAKADTPKKEGESADAANAATEKKATGEAGTDEAKNTAAKIPEDRETREKEAEKQTEKVNKDYSDRIAALRAKISAAQADLTRLQRDQVESTNEFRSSAERSPTVSTYEQQQSVLNQQIEAQRSTINGLNSQLEDTQEEARHAGVPHPFD